MGKVGVGKKKGKSKNAGVGIDFKRVKHKVGKKLAKARNETDVNFKAHTINLPSQAVKEDKEGLALNFQNLTLQELLNQTGHYNEKVRKQALLGLSDLFSRHPGELRQHTHLFLTKVAERVGDGDSAVRLALRSLLREQALPNLEPGMVRPFMPVLMAHVSSAMTNLNMEVRLDALNFVDVLMDFVPELVVSGFQSPCLLHFCDLLSPAHRGRTIKAQSIGALLKVVMSLNSYLRRAYPAAVSSSGTSSEAPQQQQQQAGKGAQAAAPASAGPGPGSSNRASSSSSSSSASALMHDRVSWCSRGAGGGAGGQAQLPLPPVCKLPCLGFARGAPPAVAVTTQAGGGRAGGGSKLGGSATARLTPGAGQAGSEGMGSGFSAAAASTADAQGLARRLVALLFECWSECGPSKAVEGPEVEPLQVLSGILSAVFTLETALLLRPSDRPEDSRAGASPAGDAAAAETRWLSDVALRRVTPVFPAAVPAVKPSLALCEALVHFNLQSSQLLAMLLPCATEADATWVQALLGYYLGVMESGEFLPTRGMLSEAVAGAGTATNAAYLSVLRGVAAALHAPGSPASCTERLLGSLRSLTARMPARSPVHAACLRMQHGLMQACRRGQLSVPAATIALWIKPLPQLLWELGDASPEVSKLALCMLHDVARYTGPDSPLGSCLKELQAQLAPLFCLHIPARKQQQQAAQQQLPGDCPACCAERGSADAKVAAARAAAGAGAAGAAAPPLVLLPGPISKLPLETQLLAIDLIYHLGRLETPLLKALAPAIHDPRVFASPSTALRLLEVTLGCMAAMEPATAASWALTLLFTDGLPTGSMPQQAAGDAAGRQRQWQRQRELVDRTCAALPRWAPLHVVLQLLEPQLEVVLAGGSAALSDAQRYSLVQLAVGLAPAGRGGLQAGRVREVLPSACLDFYASQAQQEAAAASSAAVLQVVGVHTELLLPLVAACAAAGQEAEAAGGGKGGKGRRGAAAGAEAQQHGAACLRARFCAAAALLQQLLRCRALGAALQQQRAAVRGGVAALVQRGQRSPALSGDAGCRAESKQLEQITLDVFGP